MVTEQELREFLIEAKNSCYAGNGIEITSCRPMSRDLPYRKGELYYLDSYVGELNFIGEEVVWYEGKGYWGMNFYGQMLTDQVPAEFDHCLKGALKASSPDAPFRGPERYTHEGLEYQCRWEGDLAFFSGEEVILEQGKVIYKLCFHGGYLKY